MVDKVSNKRKNISSDLLKMQENDAKRRFIEETQRNHNLYKLNMKTRQFIEVIQRRNQHKLYYEININQKTSLNMKFIDLKVDEILEILSDENQAMYSLAWFQKQIDNKDFSESQIIPGGLSIFPYKIPN